MSTLLDPIPESEYHLDFVQSSGPGGQNINKVATAVQLRFPIDQSKLLTPTEKERLKIIARNIINEDNVLVIVARKTRSQNTNRLDAIQRLRTWIEKAKYVPKTRRPTRPTAGSRTSRLKEKNIRSELKKLRSLSPDDWE